MKNASPLLTAACLLAAATIHVRAAPLHNTTFVAPSTTTTGHHEVASSEPSTPSAPVIDDKLACSAGGSGVYTTANGMTVACPSSGSTQNAVNGLLWALPVGAVALFHDNGRVWELPMLAMLVAGYAGAGLRGAMAAPVYNTTSISMLTSTSGCYDGALYTATTAAVAAASSAAAIDPMKLACSPGGSGVDTTPTGETIICPPSSASPRDIDGGWLMAFALGSLGVTLAMAQREPGCLLVLAAAALLNVGLPRAMAAESLAPSTSDSGQFANRTAIATLPTLPTSTGHHGLVLPTLTAVATSTNTDDKQVCPVDGNGIECAGSVAADKWVILFGGSDSTYSTNSRMLSTLGSAAVLVTVGGTEMTWAVALLILSWAGNGLPGAMAADMFLSITPEPGSTAPAYTNTTFALLEATSTALVTPTSTTSLEPTPVTSIINTAVSLASAQSVNGATRGILCAFGSAAVVVAIGGLDLPVPCVMALVLAGCAIAGAPKAMATETLESSTPAPSLLASSAIATAMTTSLSVDIATRHSSREAPTTRSVVDEKYVCGHGGVEFQCTGGSMVPSSASAAEVVSGMLWLFSFGAVIALIAVGRLEALALLLLLVGGWLGFGSRTVEVKIPDADLTTTTTTVTVSTTYTAWVIMTAVPIDGPLEPTTTGCGCLQSSQTNAIKAMPSTDLVATVAVTSNIDTKLYEPAADWVAQPRSAASTSASATLQSSRATARTTFKPTDACSLVGDLYDCPLPNNNVTVARSAAAALLPSTSLVIFLALMLFGAWVGRMDEVPRGTPIAPGQ